MVTHRASRNAVGGLVEYREQLDAWVGPAVERALAKPPKKAKKK